MTVAAARIEQKILISGADNASAAIKSAQKSLEGLDDHAQKAVDSAKGLGGALQQAFSGDILGAIKGVKESLGDLGGGASGKLALAAGGVAAVAAAAAGASIAFTKWNIDLTRLRAGLDASLGGDGLDRALGLASRIGGVSAESVGKLANSTRVAGLSAKFTVAQLQELTARATVVGKTGDDALTAFAEALKAGETGALKMVGTAINGEVAIKQYAKAIGISAETMTAAQRSAAVLAAVQEDLGRQTGATSTAFAQQDEALANLDNAWLAFKANITGGGEALTKIVNVTAEVIDATGRWLVVLDRGIGLVMQPALGALEGLYDAFKNVARAMDLAAAGNLGGALDELARFDRNVDAAVGARNRAAIIDFESAWDRAMNPEKFRDASDGMEVLGANIFEAFTPAPNLIDAFAKRSLDAARKVEDQAKKAADAGRRRREREAADAKAHVDFNIRQAERAAKEFDDDVDRQAAAAAKSAELQQGAAEAVAQATTAGRKTMADALRAAGQEEQALQVESRQAHADYAAEIIRIDRELAKAQQDVVLGSADAAELAIAADARRVAAREALAQKELQIGEAQKALAEQAAQASREQVAAAAEIAGGTGIAGFDRVASAVANVAKNWKGLKASAADAISAAGAVAGSFIDDTKSQAVVMAAFEGAASIAAFAAGNVPGGIGHAAAAAAFGLVAGGVIGGGATAGAISTGGGSATGGGGGGSGFAQATGGGSAGQTGTDSGGPVTIVNNYNQPLVTAGHIGKAQVSSLRSVGRTGHLKAKGA